MIKAMVAVIRDILDRIERIIILCVGPVKRQVTVCQHKMRQCRVAHTPIDRICVNLKRIDFRGGGGRFCRIPPAEAGGKFKSSPQTQVPKINYPPHPASRDEGGDNENGIAAVGCS